MSTLLTRGRIAERSYNLKVWNGRSLRAPAFLRSRADFWSSHAPEWAGVSSHGLKDGQTNEEAVVTNPKVGTIKRQGFRLYVDPDTGEKVPGVTSISGSLPKDFLKWWVAKLTAEAGVDHLGELVGIALRDRGAAVDFLKRAHLRATGGAAERGTKVHEILEELARGGKPRYHPDFKGYVAGFEAFCAEFNPEWLFLEQTVWSEAGYAGSFDAIAEVGPEDARETVLVDFKTTKSGVHADVALQLNAYAHAEWMVTPNNDGGLDRTPMPELDGLAVLHLRPEAWSLVPVALSDEVHEVFLALLAGPVRWTQDVERGVLGAPIAGGDTGFEPLED